MTTVLDENVTAVAVRGTFDDCQALVKEAFASSDLLAVDSINWARIATQVGYFIHAGARIDGPFDVVVPTGNFGNAFSCWTAKQMGVPIETITIANNANHGLADLINGGSMSLPEVSATWSPAMDIAVPSNLERFRGNPTVEFSAGWSDDDQTRQTIASVNRENAYVIDPHTATAWRAGAATKTTRPQLVVSTAHPVKFADAVTIALGHPIEIPAGFERVMGLPERVVTIDANPSDLRRLIR
jgi:threonine synthase